MLKPLLVGALFTAILLWFAVPSFAHKAPSGWTYPSDCCNGGECHQLPIHSVKETPTGWQTTQPPDDWFATGHTIWSNVTLDYEGQKVRLYPSGDKFFHVCAVQYLKDGRPEILFRCAYVPEAGG